MLNGIYLQSPNFAKHMAIDIHMKKFMHILADWNLSSCAQYEHGKKNFEDFVM